MNFFNWLTWRGAKNETPEPMENPPTWVDVKGFVPIPKWTHAGKKGKTIWCSKCSKETRVFNFRWASLPCEGCGTIVKKSEWLMPEKK